MAARIASGIFLEAKEGYIVVGNGQDRWQSQALAGQVVYSNGQLNISSAGATAGQYLVAGADDVAEWQNLEVKLDDLSVEAKENTVLVVGAGGTVEAKYIAPVNFGDTIDVADEGKILTVEGGSAVWAPPAAVTLFPLVAVPAAAYAVDTQANTSVFSVDLGAIGADTVITLDEAIPNGTLYKFFISGASAGLGLTITPTNAEFLTTDSGAVIESASVSADSQGLALEIQKQGPFWNVLSSIGAWNYA